MKIIQRFVFAFVLALVLAACVSAPRPPSSPTVHIDRFGADESDPSERGRSHRL